jgi:hypothetical protein
MGLTAGEARAGNLTMTLTWTGGSLSFDNTNATYALPGSSLTALLVNTDAVNTFLMNNGSAISFSALGASSNFPGGVPIPSEATLTQTGTAVLSRSTGATAITVATSQAGFTTPSGATGTLNSAQTAIFTNMVAGNNQTSSSSFNALNTPTLTSTTTGIQLQAYSPSNSIPVGTVVSGYTLANTATITMTGSTPGSGTTDQMQVGATLVSGAAIPEPASLILMLTGLPLPLVVVGLLRRRAAA